MYKWLGNLPCPTVVWNSAGLCEAEEAIEIPLSFGKDGRWIYHACRVLILFRHTTSFIMSFVVWIITIVSRGSSTAKSQSLSSQAQFGYMLTTPSLVFLTIISIPTQPVCSMFSRSLHIRQCSEARFHFNPMSMPVFFSPLDSQVNQFWSTKKQLFFLSQS